MEITPGALVRYAAALSVLKSAQSQPELALKLLENSPAPPQAGGSKVVNQSAAAAPSTVQTPVIDIRI